MYKCTSIQVRVFLGTVPPPPRIGFDVREKRVHESGIAPRPVPKMLGFWVNQCLSALHLNRFMVQVMVGRETSLLVENVEIVSNFLIYFSSIYEEVKWYLEEYLQSRQLEPPLSLYACRYSQLTGLGTEERIIPSLYLDILYKKRPSLCCPFFVFPSRLKERSEWQTGTNTRYVHA